MKMRLSNKCRKKKSLSEFSSEGGGEIVEKSLVRQS